MLTLFAPQNLGRSLVKRDCRVQPYRIEKLGSLLRAMRMAGLGLGFFPQTDTYDRCLLALRMLFHQTCPFDEVQLRKLGTEVAVALGLG